MRVLSLPGLTHYEEARVLQLKLVGERAMDQIPDTLLFLEHHPVITRGKGLQFTGQIRERHQPLALPLPEGIAFAESERGGDLTFHGPGQLVMYPIFKIADLGAYLRGLEKILIEELKTWGLVGRAHEHATGVWVGEKKLASIGVAVRKWVTYHGMAINCVNDLSPFQLISPCGFDPNVMTSLEQLLPAESDFFGGEWRSKMEERLTAADVGFYRLGEPSPLKRARSSWRESGCP